MLCLSLEPGSCYWMPPREKELTEATDAHHSAASDSLSFIQYFFVDKCLQGGGKKSMLACQDANFPPCYKK